MKTTFLTVKSALASNATHFVSLEGKFIGFIDEDDCWRFIHSENHTAHSEHRTNRAKYCFRWELESKVKH